ncbi:MAG: DUF1579 family protein [Planctomycetota bacterium]
MRYLIITVCAFALFFPVASNIYGQEEAGEVDQLAMYRSYAGQWDSVTETTVINGEGKEEFKTKGRWVQQDILDGAMIEVKGSGERDGEPYKYMLLYGYDASVEKHICWFYDQHGANSKMQGEWSEEDKTMTWKLVDEEPEGFSVTIVDDLSDPDQIRFTFNLRSEDGQFAVTEAGSATRARKQ